MRVLLITATVLTIAAPVFAQATGGAGNATAGGVASPDNAGAGTTIARDPGKTTVFDPTSPMPNATAPNVTPGASIVDDNARPIGSAPANTANTAKANMPSANVQPATIPNANVPTAKTPNADLQRSDSGPR